MNWYAMPSSNTTMSIYDGTLPNPRWTSPTLPFSTYTKYTDDDIFFVNAKSGRCDFDFIANYGYFDNNQVKKVFSVTPSSDTYPQSRGDTVTYSIVDPDNNSNTINIFQTVFTKIPHLASNSAASSDVQINSQTIDVYQIFITPNAGPVPDIYISQVATPSDVQIHFNKKIGPNSLVVKINTCGCIKTITRCESTSYFINDEHFVTIISNICR
jgi:hypothetical protein